MEKVLVVGSNKPMGRYLVPYFANKGYKVTALVLEAGKRIDEYLAKHNL